MIILNRLDFIPEDEFLKKKENSDDLLEYGDGEIFMLASPSTKHQRISMILSNLFFDYFKNTACEVFTAPYDIILKKENMDNYWVIPDLSVFERQIIYNLRKMSLSEIAELPDVSEGLENSIKKVANSCNTVNEFLNLIKSKRYTSTRIQRILIYCLLGITKKDMALSKKVNPYIRVFA